ncbi:MAG TPA: glutamate mutase L, partial [Leptolinea sp.]
MTANPDQGESVIAVDIGSVNTRAILFDIAGNAYRMLAAGSSPSTHLAPIRDAQEGVSAAIHQLEEITGRNLLDANHHLITPASFVGSGVDYLALSSSAGADIRIVAIGLLEEFSLANIEKLAGGTYARVVERFTLSDKRKPEDRLNAFIQSEPGLVLMAGGTNRGAGRAVLRLVDQLRLGLQASQPEKRPPVIFAGNEALADRIKETLEKLTTVFIAPNVLPFASTEDTGAAEETLSQVVNKIRENQLAGFADLEKASGVPILPSASAEARIVRFQSLLQNPTRTVLSVNVGSA